MVEKFNVLPIEKLKNLPWNKVFRMFYVEPVVFILVFAHSLSGTILKNQIIYQVCTSIYQYNESDCQQLGTNNISERANAIETEVQPYVANLLMIRTLLEGIVPAICGVFIGSWSDYYGRKPLLLISMIGFSFTYVISAIICQLSLSYDVNPWYYILAVIPHSLLGGNCVFSVAAFCFISDVTDVKSRPYRMIFMEAFFFVGLMTGTLLSSFLLVLTSVTFVFSVSSVLMCAATLFIWFCLPESLHMKPPEDDNKDDISKNIKNIETISCNALQCKTTIVAAGESKNQDNSQNLNNDIKSTTEEEDEQKKSPGLFSYVHIKDMLITCFKKRPYYDRCIIWLITGTMFLSIFVIDGVMTVFYLFVREKFHWTIREFTFYETVSHLVPMVGALLGFLILRKVFSMSVVSLALLAFFSSFICELTRGLAAEPWHLYLSIALGVFRSVGAPMCRTIVSNIVPATDLGKIFSIKNVLQSIAPFIAAPLYTLIYQQSITTYPGLFNLVSAALFLIAFVFVCVVLRLKHVHKDHYAKILK